MKEFIIWVIILVAAVGVWMLAPWQSEEDRVIKDLKSRAQQTAVEEIYWERFADISDEERQLYINAATGKEGWKFESEEVGWTETKHANFPFTINRSWIFIDPKNPKEFQTHDQLFLYDFERDIWLPISTQTLNILDGKLQKSKSESLWNKNNDWIEIFGY